MTQPHHSTLRQLSLLSDLTQKKAVCKGDNFIRIRERLMSLSHIGENAGKFQIIFAPGCCSAHFTSLSKPTRKPDCKKCQPRRKKGGWKGEGTEVKVYVGIIVISAKTSAGLLILPIKKGSYQNHFLFLLPWRPSRLREDERERERESQRAGGDNITVGNTCLKPVPSRLFTLPILRRNSNY